MKNNPDKKAKLKIISSIDPVYETKDWRLKKLRVCAYIRVSTDSRDQENSLKNQRAHYEKFIAQFPHWEYMGIFADERISGTSLKNRTGFRQMVEVCKAGKIELIVVKEVSRFARNVIDCLNTVQELLTLDPPVGIYFENNNLNTLDAGNKMFLTMFAMFAELESELKSRSVLFGLKEMYLAEHYLCPTLNLLGYDKDGKYGLKIEPEGAKTVRFIYDLFLAGYSEKRIAAVLTDLALPTATGKLDWSSMAVAGICKNEKYCGDILMQKQYTVHFLTHQKKKNTGQKEIYYETDHHEAIVSREEHARALLLLNSDCNSPFYNNEYKIEVIKRGLLAGFIPMNLAFGGYDAGHYMGALVMADIAQKNIEAEVAHIAGAKRVRRELFSERDSAAATVSKNGITFNAGCVSLLENTAYVEVLLHPNERLLAVRKSNKRNKNAIPWKNGTLPARKLNRILYQLMGWQNEWKYKITANYFSKNDEQLIIFDLNCCEFRLRSDESGRKSTRAIPSEWLSCFGSDMPEHLMLCRRALAAHLKRWEINAQASAIQCFGNELRVLSSSEAEQRIEEMRCRNAT
ncbi:MAG: recombinase family protein [Oscillospiraceae bacterium]|nr:recombinase family protein [Oscillospiraceae bacterium]